jgi:hypothetical protein
MSDYVWFEYSGEQYWLDRRNLEFRCDYKVRYDKMKKSFTEEVDNSTRVVVNL